MIDFYYWPTPNGWKVSIALEEFGAAYDTHMVNIGTGEQFTPEFAAISPNHRMPAIVDHDGDQGPVPVFESGAILFYLAQKYQQFIPRDPLGQKEILEWLFWQTGNQGPMMGQHSHFFNYAPDEERHGYGRQRYERESHRCLSVLDQRLQGRQWLVGEEYTIADMINFPWVLIAKAMQLPLDDYPNLVRWRQAVKERPAVQRGVALGKEFRRSKPPTGREREILFGQKT